MMPDLGRYALVVLSAYGVTVVMLIALVGISLWQSARMRTRLDDVERRVRE